MASKAVATTALLLSLNLLFFTLVTSGGVTTEPPPPTCSINVGVCVNVLNIPLVVFGDPPKTPCCSLVEGLADLEAAVCLCTAIKASVFGIINVNIPVDLTLLLNYCGRTCPSGFVCA